MKKKSLKCIFFFVFVIAVNATDTQKQQTHRDHELKMEMAVNATEAETESGEMEMELLMLLATCKCILLGHSNDHHDITMIVMMRPDQCQWLALRGPVPIKSEIDIVYHSLCSVLATGHIKSLFILKRDFYIRSWEIGLGFREVMVEESYILGS